MDRIKDTRGRPRNTKHEDLACQISAFHDMGALPSLFDLPGRGGTKEIRRFRSSTAYKELQEAYGNIFKTLLRGRQIQVCYRKEES